MNKTFDMSGFIVRYLQDVPFFAELSRHIRKEASDKISTAGVSWDEFYDELQLVYNPEFMASLSDAEAKGIITHEFYHIIFGHVSTRRKKPHTLWNYATDLAINSLIDAENGAHGRTLPTWVLMPGRVPTVKPVTLSSKEDQDSEADEKLKKFIASLPAMQASEFYFASLLKFFKDNDMMKFVESDGDPQEGGPGQSGNQPGGKFGTDDHGGWDKIGEDKGEYIADRIKDVLNKAAKHANSYSNGWGNIPADIREDLMAYLTSIIDWRKVLRQFIGTTNPAGRTSSIKRINRKYPYVHPGTKRDRVAKLLIAIDQSGSVGDEWLVQFFSELSSLTKKHTIDILPFDCNAHIKDIFTWKRSTHPRLERVKCGGTDFNAPTRIFNDPKNRGRWDGLIIMTDGIAPKPQHCRGKRAWVLPKGQKLEFETNETQIIVSKDEPPRGAWR